MRYGQDIGDYLPAQPIPVAKRSKARVYCSLAGIAGSNLAVGMDVCLL
jgi:hypothetical protein